MMEALLQPVWKKASKRWKHPLHNMCSYLAMFPPALPNYFIEQFTQEDDIVLDPFSGRGTVVLEAARKNRVAIGNDLNPMAVVLSKAKANIPAYYSIINRLNELRVNYTPVPIKEEPDDIKMLYDFKQTLPQLCYLKANLNVSKSKVDNFIMGALMGIMHGKHRKNGTSAYLSISMPNTFSMSPNYVRNFINEKHLVKIRQDVFQCLRDKIDSIYPKHEKLREGIQLFDNALNLSKKKYEQYKNSIKLIVTSPPYLKLINYGKYNWIRLWLLDKNSREVDQTLRIEKAYNHSQKIGLSDTLKLDQYLSFMQQLIQGWEQLLTDDGLAVIVIGDVDLHGEKQDKYIELAELVWQNVRDKTKLKLVKIVADNIDGNSKVTKIWGGERKGAATKVDKILILSKTGKLPRPNINRKVQEHFTKLYGGQF
jgi:site-specific DNA-methyltransferase (adenine-specific)